GDVRAMAARVAGPRTPTNEVDAGEDARSAPGIGQIGVARIDSAVHDGDSDAGARELILLPDRGRAAGADRELICLVDGGVHGDSLHERQGGDTGDTGGGHAPADSVD